MDSADSVPESAWSVVDAVASIPLWAWAAGVVTGIIGIAVLLYTLFLLFSRTPRPPRPSEKQYLTILPDGSVSTPQTLPCWYDQHAAAKEAAPKGLVSSEESYQIGAGEVCMSVVVPAYNEEKRLSGMLEEAVEYLQQKYGQYREQGSNGSLQSNGPQQHAKNGWEIIIVSDGSTDNTVQTALQFARTHQSEKPAHTATSGPWSGGPLQHGSIPSGSIRVVQLEENRGKGGAVTHGMRHARGKHIVFADADGASKFSDLEKLVAGCEKVKDELGRAVAVGSRAHMVGTEAVVKRSLLRNTLMRLFHLLIYLLTTRATSHIKDTQCGFKLFTRPSLSYIVPYMHTEGWIFDVEMLMLAEAASIPMVEISVGWKEVVGSKLNVVWDSVGMAVGLLVLRVGWGIGLFRRD